MKSESLEFETEFEGRKFLISYESESPSLNLLMSIIYQDLPIDTGTLRNYNLALCNHITNEMKKDAFNFWTTEDSNKLSYHSAHENFYSKFKL